jgi:DNA polymerase elongation subunit (family B)
VPEEEMILEMIDEIAQRDPDVIEGHNIFNFDLEYISARAKRLEIPLKLGRVDVLMQSHPSRIQIAERSITYTKFEVHGRHVVDTWLLAQMFDVSARSLESYGLKEVARFFQVSPTDRTYVEPEKINWYYQHDLDKLLRYALDDVRETRAISEILCQSFFYQTQIFPYSFQNIIVRGNATKIDALFIREHLASGQSIPKPPVARDFEGGYTDIFCQGVVQNVLYCDIRSLYPSIMLTFGCFPESDVLGIFPLLLKDLTAFRIQAKERAKNAASPAEAQYYQALQSTFKILINSFYGYLGFGYGHFADFNQAGKVTQKGRELITGMVQWLGEHGCQVIEIDTDGIYFKPPEGMTSDQEEMMIQELSSTLPTGIHLEMAGRYKAMFSYKIKNYALLAEDGRVIIKGSGLRSRGLELFQRRFIEEAISLLLASQPEKIQALLDQYLDNLTLHRWDKKMFVKTETLQESPAVYAGKVKAKKRNASAAYELALKSERRYQAGDQISYYVAGSGKKVRVFEACQLASEWNPLHPDENVEYYKEKLLDLYEKFQPFIQ